MLRLTTHIRRCHPKQAEREIPAVGFYGTSSAELPESSPPDLVNISGNDTEPDAVEEILEAFIDEAAVEPYTEYDINEYNMPQLLLDMVKEFEEWQQGPQGGGNKKVTAVQNAQMVKRVCAALNVQKLETLLQDSSLWRFFYSKKTKKEWTGQTSRSYMVSLKKFMMFIVKDIRLQKYSTDQERVVAQAMLTDFGNWSKSYKNQIGVESATKRVKQAEVLLTAEKMRKYRASEEYRRAFCLLSQCSEKDFCLTARKFAIVRNYLMFTLNWRNGNRAGVLGEMTLENYNLKKIYTCRESGQTQFMVTVLEHKTLATSGPAKIALSTELVAQLDLYRDQIRSKVVEGKDNCPYFFTTYQGKTMTHSSAISHYISAHAKASGLGHLTSNDCRRSATTMTREVDPSMARAVATHMSHSEVTAQKVYDIVNKDKASYQSATFLERCYAGELQPLSTVEGEYTFHINNKNTVGVIVVYRSFGVNIESLFCGSLSI